MGDRAVGQHPLDVGLGQGDEVAEGHGQNGQDNDHRQPVRFQGPECLHEQPQDQGEGTDLGADAQVAGDRGR